MKGKPYLLFPGIGTLLLLLLLSCKPQPAIPAAPAPQPTLAPLPATTIATPSLKPEEAAWAKVVEAARQEGRLNAYTFHLIGDMGRATASVFKERYGIEVQLITGPGSLLTERMRSEGRSGQHIADLLTTAVSLIMLAKGEGLIQGFGEIPVLGEPGVWVIDPRADAEGQILSIGPMILNPYINTRLVKKGEEPKSYRDLLSPEWKGGKISIGNPDLIPNINYLFWVFTDRKILDMNYFQQLGKQGLTILPDNRQDAAALSRGEVRLALSQSIAGMGPLAKEGAPIQAIDMEEGIVMGGSSGMGMAANAPHPNAARLFANWLLSAEGQTIFHRAQGDRSMRTDIPDFSPPALKVPIKRVLTLTPKDEAETARLMRERTLNKILAGK